MRSALCVTLVSISLALLLWGCALSPSGKVSLRREIAVGDRMKDWALVYYQSWRRDKKGSYLQLARTQMAVAVKTYFDIQVKMGHSFPDFYIVDRKRREGCRFLKQMEREAGKFRVVLADSEREGCLR